MNPQFTQIGQQFVTHYYKTFDRNRSELGSLYSAQSMLSFESQQFQGVEGIVQKLVSLHFQTVEHQIVTTDCQPGPNNGVIVLVTGTLLVDGGQNPLKYAQCFQLAPCPTGYFVLNDMFRLNYG